MGASDVIVFHQSSSPHRSLCLSVAFPSIFLRWIATRQAEGVPIAESPSALGFQ